MIRKLPRAMALLASALALLASAGRVGAQSEKGQITGSADLGLRSYFDRPSTLASAKFEEYRDMSAGPFLQSFELKYLPGEKALTGWEVGAENAFRRDQTFSGKLAHPGLFDLRLGWDQIPHTYASNGQMIAGASTTSPFTLPSTLTRTVADTTAYINNSKYLDPIRNEWSVGRASLAFTPGEYNDLKLEYTRISKNGNRPVGMAFGSPGGNQREILEPLDQTTNDLRLSESYARQRYQVQFSYDLNTFHNANSSITADNPLKGASVVGTTAVGRSALPPSNLAHTFSVAGGLSLPRRTRINAALSYGVRLQNEPFIPMTSNTAITDARRTVMPTSLNGDNRTLMANITASAHPVRDINLTARYRYFGLSDRTPEIGPTQMPIEIVNDACGSGCTATTDVVNEAMPYRRHTGGLDMGWRPSDLTNLKLGVAWERWERPSTPGPRNVRTNNMWTPRLTLDLTPSDWLLVRGSVSRSTRRGSAYEDDTERPQFRRFDEADKNANRGDLLLQLTPNDKVSVGFNFARAREEFPGTADNPNPMGVQNDDNTVLGGDVGWTPLPRLNLFASYTREQYNLQQHSRYGEPQNASGTGQPDNPTYDWIANSTEWVETYGIGGTANLVKNKLDAEVRYDRSNGISVLHSRNPQAPTGGSASQIANATATNWPDVTHSWNPISFFLRYQVNANWSGTIGYSYEKFDNNDFRTNGVLPGFWAGKPRTVDVASPNTDVILGNDLLPYKASYLTFTIGFRPGLNRAKLPVLSVAQ